MVDVEEAPCVMVIQAQDLVLLFDAKGALQEVDALRGR
jgi:hypothetical protein